MMKLSKDTIDVLKNFGAINQGILFRKGKKLKTVNSHKNILTSAEIVEDIPVEFGIYDLNNFLSVLTLDDSPSLEFPENSEELKISCRNGKGKIRYGFCKPNLIVTAPEKDITMPSPEIIFNLSSEDFSWILKSASILSSPHITVESDGSKMFVSTKDLSNDASNANTLEVGDGNGDVYKIIFKTEHIEKIMPGNYTISIASKGIAHFKNAQKKIEYWITTENGSTFEGSK